MNKNLQGLRGIFALFIVLHHSISWEVAGLCSVSFFFILSGFTLALAYWDTLEDHAITWKKFMKRRLWKIYPFHLLALAAALLLSVLRLNYKEILCDIPNVLLLQSWIPIKSVYFSGNALSWYLSDMLFFYALAPCIIKKVRHSSRVLLLSTIGIWITLMIILWVGTPDTYVHQLIYIFPLSRLFEFFIGACSYRAYKFYIEEKKINRGIVLVNLTEIVLLIGYVAMMILYYHLPNRYGYTALWLLPNLFLIVVFAYHSSIVGGQISQVLSSKICQLLGKCSFEIYMIHLVCLNYVKIFINKEFHSDNTLLYLLMSYAIIIIAVVLLRKYFNPFVNVIKQKYEKANSI